MSAQRHAEEDGSIYTEFDISDHLERQRDVSRFIRDSEPANERLAQLDETLDEVTEILADRYDSVEDYVPHHVVDWIGVGRRHDHAGDHPQMTLSHPRIHTN